MPPLVPALRNLLVVSRRLIRDTGLADTARPAFGSRGLRELFYPAREQHAALLDFLHVEVPFLCVGRHFGALCAEFLNLLAQFGGQPAGTPGEKVALVLRVAVDLGPQVAREGFGANDCRDGAGASEVEGSKPKRKHKRHLPKV